MKLRITLTKEGHRIYKKVGPLWFKVDSRGDILSPWHFLSSTFHEAEKTVREILNKSKFKKQHWYFGD